MKNTTPRSEIARLRQQIDLAQDACQRGLTGLSSGTARHDVIQAKMERVADEVANAQATLDPEAFSLLLTILLQKGDAV